MSRKVKVEYMPDGLVYDLKDGRNSILAAAGCGFDVSLLRSVCPDWAGGDELVVKSDLILCPFNKADSRNFSSGTTVLGAYEAVSDLGVSVDFDHMTQVCGQLLMLVVHPRLDLSKVQVRASAYNPFGRREGVNRWARGPIRSLRLVRRGDVDLMFDGKPQLDVAEKLVINVASSSPVTVRSSDFLATMSENLFRRIRTQ